MPALREIFASFGIDFDREGRLARGDRQVSAVTTRIRQAIAFVGGSMVVRGFGRFIRSTLDAADAIDKTSQQVGLSVSQFQAYSHAAALAGVDSAAFAQALGQLQRRAYDASTGQAEAVDSFRALGMSVTDASGNLLSGSDLLRGVADGLAGIENSSTRTALSMELMGRSGRRMLPMFSQGAAGLAAMEAELATLGGGVSQEFITRSVEINDNITRWRVSLASLRTAILLGMLPSINRAVTQLTRWSSAISQNAGAMRMLKIAIVAVGAAAVAAAVTTAASWLAAGWPVLAVAAAVAVLGLAVDELWVTYQGGDSILRRFIDGLFPGMVDGLSATDRAVLRVRAALADLATVAFGAWEVVSGAMDSTVARLTAVYEILSNVAVLIGQITTGAPVLSTIMQHVAQGQRTVSRFSESFAGSQAQMRGGARIAGEAYLGRSRTGAALRGESFREYLHTRREQTRQPETKVDARSTVTVTVNEAQDTAATERQVRAAIREEADRQARQLARQLAPAGGTT